MIGENVVVLACGVAGYAGGRLPGGCAGWAWITALFGGARTRNFIENRKY